MRQDPAVEGGGLPVGPGRYRPTRRREPVLEQGGRVACGLGVVGQARGLGADVQQRLEHRPVELAAARAGQALFDGPAPELVAKADVAVVHHHRQAALLALGDRAGALLTEAVLEHGELGAGRDHAHHLQRRAGRRREPRRPRQHGVADRRGRPLQPGTDRLGHEEGVARRRLVQSGDVAAVAGQLAHGLQAQRRQLHPPRAAGRDRGGHPPDRVVGGELVVAEGDDEKRGGAVDAPSEEHEEVEGRLVRPVGVLDDAECRLAAELGEHCGEGVDAPGRAQRLAELRSVAGRDVQERPERPRDGQVVAGPPEHARRGGAVAGEARDEAGLADAGLAADEGHDAPALGRLGEGRFELGERRVALEETHGRILDPDAGTRIAVSAVRGA